MKHFSKLAAITSLIITIVIVWQIGMNHYSQNVFLASFKPATTGMRNQKIHRVKFFQTELFEQSISPITTSDNNNSDKIVMGGIIPHHLVAGKLISKFFKTLTEQSPETIILLGPNHYESGNSLVITSLYSWQTAFGKVHPNINKIQKIQKSRLVAIDEKAIVDEHSLSGIFPYIKYFLPDTKIVPLMLSPRLSQNQLSELVKLIQQVNDINTVIIASVDFSHYLTDDQAQKRDETSIQLIKERQYDQIFNLNDQYLDSPASIITLLKVLDIDGHVEYQILGHTNSGQIYNNKTDPVTSYYSIIYYFSK